MSSQKTVILRGDPNVNDEFTAVAAITPGDLCELVTTTVQLHSTAAANAARIFALERDEIGKDLDDAYAASDQVKLGFFSPGDEVNAFVKAAAAAVVVGDFLESEGDGTVRKLVTDAATDDAQRASVIAVATEAVDNSGGGSKARIRILIV